MSDQLPPSNSPNYISLSFVVISLRADEEFVATVGSIMQAFSSSDDANLRHARLVEVLSTEAFDEIPSTSSCHLETVRIIGQDSSLYDAMNIGVRTSSQLGSTHVVFLNSGALFNHLLPLVQLFETLNTNPGSIMLFSAEEVVRPCKSRSRVNALRPGVLKKGELPLSMPACHQAIVYPTDALLRYPFFASPKLLVSDYMNFLALLGAGFSSVSSPLLFCRYYNNGLSANNFELSIRQRCLAYALISGRPFTAILNYTYSIVKHLMAKMLSIR